MVEFLTADKYAELEEFVSSHGQSGFTQSPRWRNVKSGWGYEAVVVRGADGKIKGSIGILIQKIPYINTAFLYAPRGPVCDTDDFETLKELIDAVHTLAKKYRAHALKIDPDVVISNTEFVNYLKSLGFSHSFGPDGFEGIQARFNYRLYLEGKNEEEILAQITQKTRYNIRVAQRKGVEMRVCGKEALDDFVRIMQVTGERDGFSTRPKWYFEKFLDSLGENVRLYMGYYEGKAVCGAITTNYGKKACYVYGASDNEYRNVMPNYLMQWEMIRWAIETGCTVYDFQGISGNLEEGSHMYGLYRFKRGFSGQIDELVGEFDYIYKPFSAKLVDFALEMRTKMRKRKTS